MTARDDKDGAVDRGDLADILMDSLQEAGYVIGLATALHVANAIRFRSARSHALEIDCPKCKGSGTMDVMTHGYGPDDHLESVQCDGCKGTGTTPSTIAPIKAADLGELRGEWPGDTVADLVKNLQTLPPQMPVYTAYFVEIEGKNVAKVIHPSISRETVDRIRGRLDKFDPEAQSLVIWATQDARSAESATPRSDANSCPACGADLCGRPEWAVNESRHSLDVLAIIEEVEAHRRGVAVTHAVDPLPGLKQRMGSRESLESTLQLLLRRPDGGKATP